MNYHIAIDHKYVEGYISDVLKIRSGNNLFLIRSTSESSRHITKRDCVHFVGNEDGFLLDFMTNNLKKGDKLFIHWLDRKIGDLILNVDSSILIFNVHWGGELLEDPYQYHSKWIYAPITAAYLDGQNKLELKKRIRERKLLTYPFLWYLQFKESRKIQNEYKLKKRHVQRLNYNILHPANTVDADLARSLFKHSGLVDRSGFYDLNFDLANKITVNRKTEYPLKILLNNAAFYSGNHLDAFYLLTQLEGDYTFYCPLTYLETDFRDMLVEKGAEILGDRFHAITTWMTKEKYLEFLSEIDVVFMYQNISQGFGNIVAALTMGKPVFLKERNGIKQLLKNINIDTYNADQILSLDLLQICKQAALNAEANRAKLENAFSEKTRLRFLKELLS